MMLCLLARTEAGGTTYQVELWWLSPAIQSQIALTPDQVQRIDATYRESLPERRRLRRQVVALRLRLARLLATGTMSDVQAIPLIDRLCTIEKQRNVARTMMLIRMHRVLTAPQRLQLAEWSDRRPGGAKRAADTASAFFLP
jgi:Spy/CpxP family protein refolding chaperone